MVSRWASGCCLCLGWWWRGAFSAWRPFSVVSRRHTRLATTLFQYFLPASSGLLCRQVLGVGRPRGPLVLGVHSAVVGVGQCSRLAQAVRGLRSSGGARIARRPATGQLGSAPHLVHFARIGNKSA